MVKMCVKSAHLNLVEVITESLMLRDTHVGSQDYDAVGSALWETE